MWFLPIILAVLVIIAIAVAEYWLTRFQWFLGLIFPVATVVVALLVDFIFFWFAAVLCLVFCMGLVKKYMMGGAASSQADG